MSKPKAIKTLDMTLLLAEFAGPLFLPNSRRF